MLVIYRLLPIRYAATMPPLCRHYAASAAKCRYNMPHDWRIATVYYKPSRNQTDMTPDYYVHETEQWLVFPHEIVGLSVDEIRAHKPGAGIILGE